MRFWGKFNREEVMLSFLFDMVLYSMGAGDVLVIKGRRADEDGGEGEPVVPVESVWYPAPTF